jgi:hypothetical protein
VHEAIACELPRGSRLRASLPRVDHLDSYSIPISHPDLNLVSLYAGAFGHMPAAFKHLLVLRSIIVKPLGISGVSHRDLAQPIDPEFIYVVGDKIGRWTLFERSTDELITGANDKHLDFRVSLFREPEAKIVLSTAVMRHNAFGRAYLATILPFHRFGVSALLSNAAKNGQI